MICVKCVGFWCRYFFRTSFPFMSQLGIKRACYEPVTWTKQEVIGKKCWQNPSMILYFINNILGSLRSWFVIVLFKNVALDFKAMFSLYTICIPKIVKSVPKRVIERSPISFRRPPVNGSTDSNHNVICICRRVRPSHDCLCITPCLMLL